MMVEATSLLAQHPGEGQLRHRQPGSFGDRRQLLDRLEQLVGLKTPHRPVHGFRSESRVLRRRLSGLVLAGQHSLSERRPDDLGDAVLLAEGDQLGLGGAPDHRVLRLRGDELLRAGDLERRLDLLDGPLAEADLARLARLADLGQRLHGLLDRDVRIGAMALVEVDVVGLQPLERGIDLLVDLLSGEAAVGLRHREENLGRQDVGAAVEVLEDRSPGRLRGALAVDVGSVEEVDVGFEGGLGAGLGLVSLDPGAVGEPGAE